MKKNGRNLAATAATAIMLSAPLSISTPPPAKADELSDLRANQDLLQRRLDQLAQARVPGNLFGVGGPPGPTTVQMMGGSFPRSFLIPGTNTSIRVGGEARLNFLHWFSGGNPNAAHNTNAGATGQVNNIPLYNQASITSVTGLTLPTGGVGSARRRGENVTSISPAQSKLNFESRTPTAWGEVRTFIEFDFANQIPAQTRRLFAVADNISARLRFAYGTIGGFLAGQANSNFGDSDASMETLSFAGLVGDPGHARIPQIRYTMPLAGWRLPGAFSMSIEQPESEMWAPPPLGVIGTFPSPAAVAGNPMKAPVPDVTAAWYIPQPWGHVDFSGVVRPTVQLDDGLTKRTYVGWGTHFGGDVKPRWFGWDRDFITWHAVFGEGIGPYHNVGSGNGGLGLVSNYTQALSITSPSSIIVKPVVAWGGNVGYRHYWAPNLRSNMGAGIYHADVNTLRGVVCAGGRDATAVAARANGSGGCGLNKQLVTAAINMIWNPVPFVDFGVEYFYGLRKTVGDQYGSENVLLSRFRVQF